MTKGKDQNRNPTRIKIGSCFTEEYLTLYKQINVLLASNRMYQRNDSTRANQGDSLLFTSNAKNMPCQRRGQHVLVTIIWEDHSKGQNKFMSTYGQ